jgi:hypothetical protein
MPIVLKSGSLTLLEPSGPVKACDGIALPYTLQLESWTTKKIVVFNMCSSCKPALVGASYGVAVRIKNISGWFLISKIE